MQHCVDDVGCGAFESAAYRALTHIPPPKRIWRAKRHSHVSPPTDLDGMVNRYLWDCGFYHLNIGVDRKAKRRIIEAMW
jgi:hypothetical protein